jgi:uncharacterized repeat protein (TIGR04076 family)
MSMGHFQAGPPGEFWKGFQQHMGFSDEELANFRNDPKKAKAAEFIASPKLRNSTLIFEVVESHGCGEGMKVGDKLYFTGCANLDPKRSSNWCAYALSYATTFALVCHSMMIQGLDPNEMFTQYFSCFDCGTRYGWGLVVMKAYVIDESKK